jgi:hypothetical protein
MLWPAGTEGQRPHRVDSTVLHGGQLGGEAFGLGTIGAGAGCQLRRSLPVTGSRPS